MAYEVDLSSSDDSDEHLFDDSDDFCDEPLPPVPKSPNPTRKRMSRNSGLRKSASLRSLSAKATGIAGPSPSSPSDESTRPVRPTGRPSARTTAMQRTKNSRTLTTAGTARSETVKTSFGVAQGVASFSSLAAAAAGGATVRATALQKSVSTPTGARPAAAQRMGWLTKKGKKRWFLLRGKMLYWFSKEVDPSSDIAKGVNNYLRLAGCKVTATESPPNSMQIVPRDPKEKPYTLTAADQETRARWLAALRAGLALRENTSVVTSGYMTKKGKRRFFVIEDDQLKWYLTSKCSKAEFKGCLQLATCRLSGQPAHHTLVLDSTTAVKSYAMKTSSPDEFRHWMRNLEHSIAQARASFRERHGSDALLGSTAVVPSVVSMRRTTDDVLAAEESLLSKCWSFQIQQSIPVTSASGKAFTAYLVESTPPRAEEPRPSSTVLKRYSQFDELHASLVARYKDQPDVILPQLPTKKLVGNMNPQFIRTRCLGLQKYMNQVALLPGIGDSSEFLYFITEQTQNDGWSDSAPLSATEISGRWRWLSNHTPVSTEALLLVDERCATEGELHVEIGNDASAPWLSDNREPVTPRGGGDIDEVQDLNMVIEEAAERDVLYYKTFFATTPHDNYVAGEAEGGPYVLTVDTEGIPLVGTTYMYRALLRSKRGDRRASVSMLSSSSRHQRVKELRLLLGIPDAVHLMRVKGEDAELLRARLLEYEEKLIVRRYKFGVLRVTATQRDAAEDEIYANSEIPDHFATFLDVLGERIDLLGWSGYTGGLNTRDGSTGNQSVFTTFASFEVMFHVAALLPYSADDTQQVERKRHLGNDVVLVIYMDPEASHFDPRILRSHFNSAFVVVRPAKDELHAYDVATAYRSGVRLVRPLFGPDSRIRGSRDDKHALLLTKLINLERSAMSSGEFVGLDMRTRNMMLGDIVGHHIGNL